MAKVAVIGAGIGGLSVAARLAKAGHKVEIFEQSNVVGGKCRTEWIDGFAFDTGPSLLTLPAVYRELFTKTGKRLEHVLDLEPVDPAFTYQFADGKKLDFANLSNPKTYLQISNVLGANSAKQWQQVIERAERMWDASRIDFIESELKSAWQLMRKPNFVSRLRTIAPNQSLRRFGKKIDLDAHLQMIIDRYATYSGSDPRSAPAVLLTIAFIEATFGAWHIKGGIGKLAIALEQRNLDLGVSIRTNTEVEQIITDNRKVTGIKLTGGETIAVDLVVSNADAGLTYEKLIESKTNAVRKARKSIARVDKSLAGFSLLLGLRKSEVKLNHHNVFFPKDYDAEFDQIFKMKVPVSDPTIYICAPNDPSMVKDPTTESWFVLVNAPIHDLQNGFDWRGKSNAYGEKLIKRLDDLGLQVTNRLIKKEFRSPLDLEKYAFAPGGAIYGTSSNSPRAAFWRAKNRGAVSGLFLVGGSAHPGGGLPLVGISAEIVANAIGKA